jgi:D-sedoheptulose 7-phosphate isomerase
MKKKNEELQREMLRSVRSLEETAQRSAGEVAQAARLIAGTFRRGRKLLICGNGGSAADSQHVAAELVVRFVREGRALPALALTTDGSVLTAEANDHGYQTVFSRQVEALGQKGDLLLAITTSGRSANVIAAARAARKKGMTVIGLTGPGSGPLDGLCRLSLKAYGDATCLIQESMLMIEHNICRLVEEEFRHK